MAKQLKLSDLQRQLDQLVSDLGRAQYLFNLATSLRFLGELEDELPDLLGNLCPARGFAPLAVIPHGT